MAQERTDRRRGAPSARRATGQVVLAALTGVAALVPLWAALRLISSDLGSAGEKFDGLGTALGGVMLIPVALAALAVAWWWWRGRGRPAGWVALALGALVVGAELVWVGLMGLG